MHWMQRCARLAIGLSRESPRHTERNHSENRLPTFVQIDPRCSFQQDLEGARDQTLAIADHITLIERAGSASGGVYSQSSRSERSSYELRSAAQLPYATLAGVLNKLHRLTRAD